MNIVKKLTKNTIGRDFVVGDIHGMYDRLFKGLELINFDFNKDRLFSVGDLIDRGSQNLECLSLLDEPWFHSVLGNHDLDLIRHIEYIFFDSKDYDEEDLHLTIYNGGRWRIPYLQNTSKDEILTIYNKLKHIPYVISVGEDSRFNVVHSVLVNYDDIINNTSFSLYTDKDIDNNKLKYFYLFNIERALVKASTLISLDKNFPGLSRTFCGHTILEEPIMALSHVHIDTGGFLSKGKLTIVCTNNDKIYQV